MGKTISTSEKISFHKQELPPPNFKRSEQKKAQQSSEKKYSFTRRKNSFPLAEIKNSLKITFPLDKKTVFTASNIWQMGKTIFISQKKQFLL